MAHFRGIDVDLVLPKVKESRPSFRKEIQKEYDEAVREILINRSDLALTVEVGDDKPHTVRNRVVSALNRAGLTDMVVGRKKNVVFAYRKPQEEKIVKEEVAKEKPEVTENQEVISEKIPQETKPTNWWDKWS